MYTTGGIKEFLYDKIHKIHKSFVQMTSGRLLLLQDHCATLGILNWDQGLIMKLPAFDDVSTLVRYIKPLATTKGVHNNTINSQ